LPLVELKAESKAQVDRVMAEACAGHPSYLIGNVAGRDRDIVLPVDTARPRPRMSLFGSIRVS
jgi:hypothetical protein